MNLKKRFGKISETLKMKLWECEEFDQNLVEILNAERCEKRVHLVDLVKSFQFKQIFTCKIRLRYSRERASQSLFNFHIATPPRDLIFT